MENSSVLMLELKMVGVKDWLMETLKGKMMDVLTDNNKAEMLVVSLVDVKDLQMDK